MTDAAAGGGRAPLPSPAAGAAGAPGTRAGLIMVALAAMSWGTWSLFLRPTQLPATVTTPIIFLVMGLASLPVALRGPRVTWDRTSIGLVIANAVFDAANVMTFFAAIQHTTVAIAVLSHYVAPILVALAAPRIDGIVTRGAGPAALVALVGLVIILEPWRAPADGAVLGAALGVASAFCYAGNVFTVRRIAARVGAARAMSYHALLAAVVMAPLVAGRLDELTLEGTVLLVGGGMTVGAAAGVVFSLGLLRIGSARAAILCFIEPIVAVALGVLVWHEPLRPLAAVGGVLVLGAGLHVVRSTR